MQQMVFCQFAMEVMVLMLMLRSSFVMEVMVLDIRDVNRPTRRRQKRSTANIIPILGSNQLPPQAPQDRTRVPRQKLRCLEKSKLQSLKCRCVGATFLTPDWPRRRRGNTLL